MPADRFRSPMKVRGHPAALHPGDVLQGRRARAARRAGGGLSAGCEARRGWPSASAPSRSSIGSRAWSRACAPRGAIAIPGRLPRFPACLVAEAVGQLAAWVAMAQLDFRRRPVAGLAGETLFVGGAAPGQMLDLAVEIETCDEDAVAYGGSARVDGDAVLELRHCVGPMLPMEEFDAPEAVRGGLRGALRPGRAGRSASGSCRSPRSTVIERVPGKRCARRCACRASAPFFGDHFPRRPVFPGTLLLDRADRARRCELAGEACRAARRLPRRPRDRREDARVHRAGQAVEIAVELQPQSATARSTASLAARVGGKTGRRPGGSRSRRGGGT